MFFEDEEFEKEKIDENVEPGKKLTLFNNSWSISNGVLEECKIADGEDVVNVPDGVEELGILSMGVLCRAKEVNLPKSVKKLDEYAMFMFELEKLNIENKDIHFTSESIACSRKLKDVYIAGEKQEIIYSKREDDDGIALEKYFRDDTEVIVEEGVAEICTAVFEDRRDITDVYLPDSVLEIGVDSFSGCTGIKELKVPKNTEWLSISVFGGWQKDQTIYVPVRFKKFRLFQKWRKGCKAKIVYY